MPAKRTLVDRLRWIFRIANRLETAQLRHLGTSGMALLTRRQILVLETTGRRTGKIRSAPVAYHEEPDGGLIIGGGAVGMTRVDWVANLRARPRAHVWIGRRRIPEYQEVRAAAFERYRGAHKYEARSGRAIPYFRLTRSPDRS